MFFCCFFVLVIQTRFIASMYFTYDGACFVLDSCLVYSCEWFSLQDTIQNRVHKGLAVNLPCSSKKEPFANSKFKGACINFSRVLPDPVLAETVNEP